MPNHDLTTGALAQILPPPPPPVFAAVEPPPGVARAGRANIYAGR